MISIAPVSFISRAAVVLILVGGALAGCATQKGSASRTGSSKAGSTGVSNYVDGVRAYRSGDRAQAITSLEAATTANPNLTMACSLLGDIYKEGGNYTKAADQYRAVTDLDPYTPRNFYKLGVTYHLLARLNDATVSYLKAIKLNPRDWESHMNVGLVYLALGKKDDATTHLSQATIINPGAGVAFGNLAIALDAQNRFADAESAYRRALELDSTDTASLGNLGKNLMRQKKVEPAVAVLRKLAEITDSASARKLYGDSLVMAKRNDDAIKLYQAILKEDSKYYPALNGMGAALIGKYEQSLQVDDRQKDAAMTAWKQSLALNPQQPRVEELVQKWAR